MTQRADRLGALVTERPVAVLMLFVAAVVFGWFSYERLPLTLMPELEYPTLTVRTAYPGAAPEEVENDVSRPIEEALGVVGGLVRISSISRAGLSDVVLEFGWETEIPDATQEVLEKLDLVFLPQEAQRPLILHYDPELDPVMELSLSGRGPGFAGDAGQRRLRRIADIQVRRALEPIEGVAAVRVRGGLEEQIQVLLEEEQLRRTGISIAQVIERLRQENVNLAGGMIEEGETEYMVRTVGEFVDLGQIAETVVAIVDGREVSVEDLGRVAMSNKDREIFTRTDGAESVQVEILKEADANIVALAERIREEIGAAPSGTPATEGVERLAGRLMREEGAELRVVADRSVFIRASIDEVRNTALIGMLLATGVLFLFLRNVTATLIIFVSIPISVLVTFAPLNLLGVSLNIMSLGGLALGIGMLVDNSIVVLESIQRCREEGDDAIRSAVRGTAEVRSAVTSSTLTTIAVFFPMIFVQGVAGQAFGDLGLAVTISLLASLVVALFLIPMLASRAWSGGSASGAGKDGQRGTGLRSVERYLEDSEGRGAAYRTLVAAPRLFVSAPLELAGRLALLLVAGFAAVLAFAVGRVGGLVLRVVAWLPLTVTGAAMQAAWRLYPRVLRAALAHPLIVVLLVAGSLWVSWSMLARLDSELLPEVRQGEFTVEVELPVGTPVEQTNRTLSPIEDALLTETSQVRSAIMTVGRDPSRSESSDEGEHTARLKVLLEPGVGRRAEDRVVAEVRGLFEGIPDVDARLSRPVLFSFKTPIELEIRGDDLESLRSYGQQARDAMRGIPGLVDVELSQRRGAPEVEIRYDRDLLAAYGLSIGDVARLVRSKVQGSEATRFNMRDRRIPIITRLAPEDRETLENVRSIVVNPGGARAIPLSAIATVGLSEGPSEVRRIDGRRVALVTANVDGIALSDAVSLIEEKVLEDIDWPVDMSASITGQNQEWERSQASLWLALGLSVFLVYVIMAAQFESLVHPLVIMFSIPLAFVGTLLLLLLTGTTISIVVLLGVIMLAGIVVNNAIILVDYTNQLRGRGMTPSEAIVTAGRVRLRPIFMTTATTVLALAPMALGLGQGAELRTPMALAVIGGITSSTILTLVVVPVFYWLADRATFAIRSRISSALGDTAPAGPETPSP